MNTLKKGFFTLLIAVLAVCTAAFAWLSLIPANVAYAAPGDGVTIEINGVFEWQGINTADATPVEGAEYFILKDGPLYVYSPVGKPDDINAKIYSASILNEDKINAGYNLTEVINANNAVALNHGGEITVSVKIGDEYADAISVTYEDMGVTPGIISSSELGQHQAVAKLTINDGYGYTLNDSNSNPVGIKISDDKKSAILTKDWYIAKVGNPLIVYEEPSEDEGNGGVIGGIETEHTDTPWSISGWIYNELETAPEAPVLAHGDSTQVTFSLRNNDAIEFEDISLADFKDYINASMPTGTYSLTFTVPEQTVEGIVYDGYGLTFGFTVSPSSFKEEWRTDIVNKLKGNIEYKAVQDEHGQYAFQLHGNDADLEIWNYFEDKSFNPERTGVWAENDYSNYYSDGYTLTYNLEIQSNNVYQSYEAMQAIGTPAAPGTYIVYYQLEAHNYESLTNIMNESGRRSYTFTIVIYDIIDLPAREYDYTGNVQLVPSTSLYTVEKIGTDTYTERGEHTVKLVSADAAHYRFVNAQNAVVNEIEFTYTIRRVDNSTVKFQFTGWEWNGYDESKLPVWQTEYEDTTDKDFYSYYIENEEGTKYYPADFADAPMGLYIIYCTAKGYDRENEGTAQYSYNMLTYSSQFSIREASNKWIVTPDVIQWQYNSFNPDTHRFLAEAMYSSDTDPVLFSIATDDKGEHIIDGLRNFTTNSENKITDEQVIKKLNALEVGTYYLISRVNGTSNYDGLTPQPHSFAVQVADNLWNTVPGIETWITGKFDPEVNVIAGEALFGEAHFRIVSAEDEEVVIYDDLQGIDELSSAPVGSYILTVTVADDVNGNFKGISEFLQFRIFEKPGLPWWATVIIVVAALGLAALVMYILHQKGVLQLLTGKIIIAMRTKATVDATIAAIRANKVAADAKKTVAAARLQDANEARKRKKEELKNMTLEEQAAALEQQAREAAEKAEKFDKKATRTQKRAERLKKQLESEQTATDDEPAGDEGGEDNETPDEGTDNNQE